MNQLAIHVTLCCQRYIFEIYEIEIKIKGLHGIMKFNLNLKNSIAPMHSFCQLLYSPYPIDKVILIHL